MNVNLLPFVVVWAVLAAVVLFLMVYRRTVASTEDDSLHVLEGAVVSEQATMARRLDKIDRWGKSLTVVVIVLGLAVASVYVYQSWIQESIAPVMAQ